MANPAQKWISGSRPRTTTAALAFTVVFLLMVVVPPSPQAQNFTLLHSFAGNGGAGNSPRAGLVQDAAGNLYGTTAWGGGFRNGTVFKLDTAGKSTVLHTFSGGSADGALPEAGLVRDKAGNLYGTTYSGGKPDCGMYYACGVVFKLDAAGKETVLHSFADSPDGANPSAGLTEDAAGNFYGTTTNGGALGTGTIYEINATGTESVLYSFAAGSDGAHPVAALVRDAAGNLYGTTEYGGTANDGTVFKLDTAGKETVLYNFCSQSDCTDGANPVAGLIRDAAGNLYGTTPNGGTYNLGTAFKLVPPTP